MGICTKKRTYLTPFKRKLFLNNSIKCQIKKTIEVMN